MPPVRIHFHIFLDEKQNIKIAVALRVPMSELWEACFFYSASLIHVHTVYISMAILNTSGHMQFSVCLLTFHITS